jgi:Na+/proline symporter
MMPNLFLIFIQFALMLGPPWFALRAARLAKAEGAQADRLIRWAIGVLAVGVVSLLFGYYSIWKIHTDGDNVDTPGIVLMLEELVYPLLAVFITLPLAAFIWKRSKNKLVKLHRT